jgi:hypothetical protein
MRDAILEPRKSQWLVMAAVLLLVIPALVYLVVPNDAALVLIRRFETPALEASLGFTAGHVALPPASGVTQPVFAVTAVTPGGAFWRAGIRAGDVPTGYKHGLESGFLWDLIWGRRQGSVVLKFVPAEAAGRGQWGAVRTVTVTYPKS